MDSLARSFTTRNMDLSSQPGPSYFHPLPPHQGSVLKAENPPSKPPYFPPAPSSNQRDANKSSQHFSGNLDRQSPQPTEPSKAQHAGQRGRLRPRAILTSRQAMDIFRLSLPAAGRPTATAVAREYGVSEKAVRDIWTARTWADDTSLLDPRRPPRPFRPTGRPLGRLDAGPRRGREGVRAAKPRRPAKTEPGPAGDVVLGAGPDVPRLPGGSAAAQGASLRLRPLGPPSTATVSAPTPTARPEPSPLDCAPSAPPGADAPPRALPQLGGAAGPGLPAGDAELRAAAAGYAFAALLTAAAAAARSGDAGGGGPGPRALSPGGHPSRPHLCGPPAPFLSLGPAGALWAETPQGAGRRGGATSGGGAGVPPAWAAGWWRLGPVGRGL